MRIKINGLTLIILLVMSVLMLYSYSYGAEVVLVLDISDFSGIDNAVFRFFHIF